MYTTVAEAEAEYNAGLQDMEAEGMDVEEVWYDIASAVADECIPSVRKEFKRFMGL
jgi:hypothetical protein